MSLRYTSAVPSLVQKEADSIKMAIEELLGVKAKEWHLLLREPADGSGLQVTLRTDPGRGEEHFIARTFESLNRSGEVVVRYLRKELRSAGVLK